MGPTESGKSALGRVAVGVALAGTLALGLWLRWGLAGRVPVPGDFANLRHAHSHLGYFGVLFPLAWGAWRRAGAPVPGRRLLVAYAAATVLSFAGFVRAGYGLEAIVGSTMVGAVWLLSAWPLRTRFGDARDPLAVVPLGVVAALACVPPIALNLRTAPEVAQGFVATFLATLLLCVMIPSVLATTPGPRAPWPLVAVCAGAGAVALGVSASLPARGGLLAYAAMLAWFAAGGALPGHARAVWAGVAVGLAAVATGLLPNTRPVAVGAIHFLILGPVLESLLPPSFRSRIPAWAWWVHHAAVTLLAVPLVLQGLGAATWTLTASAVGGSGVVLWWLGVGVASLLHAEHGVAFQNTSEYL